MVRSVRARCHDSEPVSRGAEAALHSLRRKRSGPPWSEASAGPRHWLNTRVRTSEEARRYSPNSKTRTVRKWRHSGTQGVASTRPERLSPPWHQDQHGLGTRIVHAPDRSGSGSAAFGSKGPSRCGTRRNALSDRTPSDGGRTMGWVGRDNPRSEAPSQSGPRHPARFAVQSSRFRCSSLTNENRLICLDLNCGAIGEFVSEVRILIMSTPIFTVTYIR